MVNGTLSYAELYGLSLAIWDQSSDCSDSVTFHPTQVNILRLNPATQVGTRFTYPVGMEG